MNNLSARQFFAEGSGMVTLCGSSRFYRECMEANRALTFQNWIVLMCGNWEHSYHKDADTIGLNYDLIKTLHFQKIIESDAIVVVSDSSFYYGDSTILEIAFAKRRNKPVFYFDGKTFSGVESIIRMPDRYSDRSLIDSFFSSIGIKNL